MSNLLFTFIIFTNFINFASTTFRKYELSKLCPSYAPHLSGDFPESQKFVVSQEFLTRAQNIANLMQSMTIEEAYLGHGGFGSAFEIESTVEEGDSDTFQKRVMKVVKVPNTNDKDDLSFQADMIREIQVLDFVKTLPDYRLFFVDFFFCADIEKEANVLKTVSINHELDEKVSSLISVTKKEGLISLEFEKLDFALFEHIAGVKSKTTDGFDMTNRVKMAFHLLTGLEKLNEHYTHCDLKPENLMFSLLTKAQMPQYKNSAQYLLRDRDNHSYIIKFIDFGLSRKVNQEKCEGGTPGYVPHEYFTGRSHKNFDVFSLGVILVDLELTYLGFPFLSNMLKIMMYGKAKVEYRRTLMFPQLQKNSMYTILTQLLAKEGVKDQIFGMLDNEAIFNKYKQRKFAELETIMKIDVHVLEFTYIRLVFILLENYRRDILENQRTFFQNHLQDNIQALSEKVQGRGKDMSKNTELIAEIQLNSAHFGYTELERKMNVGYYNALQMMLTRDSMKRPSANEMLQFFSEQFNKIMKISQINADFVENYAYDESDKKTFVSELFESVTTLNEEDLANRDTVILKMETNKSEMKFETSSKSSGKFILI